MRAIGLPLFVACLGLGSVRQNPSNATEERLVKVPALQGRTPDLSQQMLRLLELTAERGVFYIAAESWREDLAAGLVQMQTPQPGSPLPEGGTVAFWTF